MKRIIGYTLAIIISSNLHGQPKFDRSPLSQEFVDYVKMINSPGYKKSSGKYGTGYVPSPMYLHFNPVHVAKESRKSTQVVLPAKFDQRDSGWITPVKNQGSLGACWSFSTMGAVESRFIRLKKGTSIDLSEQNMATCHGFLAGINDGGSDFIAAAYLTRLSGPVTEASDPYTENINAVCGPGPFVIPAYTPRAVWLPKDINIIKKIIKDNGPVTTSIFFNDYNKYYSFTDYTYYYNGVSAVDHGVLIVGWDDNKIITGGVLSPAPGSKGAWIVKNSWGTSFGENGFFYVSYKDSKFLSSVSYFPDVLDKSEVDTLYINDRLGATSSLGYRKETAYAVEKFVAPKEHFIRKIGTFVNASGTVVDIDIYNTFQGDSILKDPIASSHNNISLFPGYETFDIPAKVNGDFYVKIKYFTPGFNFPIPIETEILYQGKLYATPSILPKGSCWVGYDGIRWTAMGNNVTDNEADLCIRVYADKSTELNAFFSVNKTTTCINSPVTLTQASNGTINSYSWNFGTGANPATANTAGPHQVSYSSTGKKNITLTITGPGGTKTLVKNNYIEVVGQLDIILPYSEVKLVKGKSLPITAFGADSYTWSPSSGLNTTSGASVIASPTDTITYTVNGTIGTCTGTSTLKVNVVKNPVNDKVCDAIMLQLGYNGPFTNRNATVEAGEPLPDTTNCNTQKTWCEKEGGLQASVWFKFVANKPTASFTSGGMDTQIALYDANSCEAILTKKYTLLAANDDYFPKEKFFAAALQNVALTEGKTYYLQMDGSAGGEEGDFYIEIWNAPVGNEQIKISGISQVNIFPNPTTDQVRLYLKETPGYFRVILMDITGKTIINDEIKAPEGTFEKSYMIPEKGLYFIKVTGNGINYIKRIIRQ